MNKHQKNSFLTLIFLVATLVAFADGPEELGKFIMNVVIGFIVFVVGLISLLWYFRKDHSFIGFTILNLMIFIFLLAYALGGGFGEDRGTGCFLYVVLAQILAQLIYIIKVFLDKNNNKKREDEKN